MISPASVQLFSGLEDNQIKAIKDAATRREFDATQIIAMANEPANRLFLIGTGYVDYYVTNEAGRDILLRRLAAGDVFGVGSLLSRPIGYLGTAKAVEHIYVLEWKDRVIRQLAKAYPQLVENALRTVLRYLALYARRHIRLVTNTAQERLACALSSLGSRAGHAVLSGVEVDIKNEDLASLADMSFFTASRILKGWDRNGVVEKSRGKVVIRAPEKLLAA
ncbi:MAG TPA: Crp/Fnr family transcriptional regulator [Candidatus Sulfotelmatobacter sp.]|nr:Crp/Fnr family transcriptional regulator [Candidatus Sulfotelmatobacter sp.]